MAHALNGYNGPCSNIHGHSYELHVTVKQAKGSRGKLIPPGFIIDFKELKEIVNSKVKARLDHKLVLSHEYTDSVGLHILHDNLFMFSTEPTAENLLLFISRELMAYLPLNITLHSLKLYETNSSYAEWINENKSGGIECKLSIRGCSFLFPLIFGNLFMQNQ